MAIGPQATKTVMRFLFCCLLLTIAEAVNCQTLCLYEIKEGKRNYLWARHYQADAQTQCSEVIMADTVATKVQGAVCQITMSNAFVCHTRIVDAHLKNSTNSISQFRYYVDVLNVNLPKNTKVIFDNSAKELWQLKLNAGVNTHTTTDKGEAAAKELKKRGLQPPRDTRR